MTTEVALIIIIVLFVFAFIWMGIALHLARTVAQMQDYLKQLEKDYINATNRIILSTIA